MSSRGHTPTPSSVVSHTPPCTCPGHPRSGPNNQAQRAHPAVCVPSRRSHCPHPPPISRPTHMLPPWPSLLPRGTRASCASCFHGAVSPHFSLERVIQPPRAFTHPGTLTSSASPPNLNTTTTTLRCLTAKLPNTKGRDRTVLDTARERPGRVRDRESRRHNARRGRASIKVLVTTRRRGHSGCASERKGDTRASPQKQRTENAAPEAQAGLRSTAKASTGERTSTAHAGVGHQPVTSARARGGGTSVSETEATDPVTETRLCQNPVMPRNLEFSNTGEPSKHYLWVKRLKPFCLLFSFL